MSSVIDQLNHARVAEVVPMTYRIVDAIQGQRAGVQIAATALLFAEICRHLGIWPTTALLSVDRMTGHALQQEAPTIRALQAYIAGELCTS